MMLKMRFYFWLKREKFLFKYFNKFYFNVFGKDLDYWINRKSFQQIIKIMCFFDEILDNYGWNVIKIFIFFYVWLVIDDF